MRGKKPRCIPTGDSVYFKPALKSGFSLQGNKKEMEKKTHLFKAEVGEMLDLVINSLYSKKEICSVKNADAPSSVNCK